MSTTDTDPRGDYALCRRLLDEIDALRRETEAAWRNAGDHRAECRAVAQHLVELDSMIHAGRDAVKAAEDGIDTAVNWYERRSTWRGSTARLRANTKEAR